MQADRLARWLPRAMLYVAGSSLLGLAVPASIASDVATDFGYESNLYADAWGKPAAGAVFALGVLLVGAGGYALARSGRDIAAILLSGAGAALVYGLSARLAFPFPPDGMSVVFWGFPGLVFSALAPAWLASRDAASAQAIQAQSA